MNNLINWSEVSRLLTGDRTTIRSNYSGKKYKKKIDRLKKLIEVWELMEKDMELCPECKMPDIKPYKNYYCCYACGHIFNRLKNE